MGARWGPRLTTVELCQRDALNLLFICLVLLQAQVGRGGATLNGEGMALLELRERVEADPHGAFRDWNPTDATPCGWSGVQCFDGKVEILNLTGRELVGTLAPEIGGLQLLKSLLLPKNNFRGQIPKEFRGLTALEVLDLSSNNLDGTIPEELRAMPLLKQLSLHDNHIQDGISSLNTQGIAYEQAGCLSRKLGCWVEFKDWTSFSGLREKYSTNLASLSEPHIIQNLQSFASAMRRRLLSEAGNLPALSGNDAKSPGPENSEETQRAIDVLSLGSGSFSAFPNSDGEVLESTLNADAVAVQSVAANQSTGEVSSAKYSKWLYFMILPAAILLISLIVAPILLCRKQGRAPIGPWKTGLSGPLQKALITGVPKLNRPELEAACEDFSNIINTFPSCTVFKGTLSSGVEISVVSTAVSSIKDWPRSSETCFKKKIDTLSRVNHKNFINLLGYCLENQPFMRMMVFEYAPNGTLSEHLHLKEFEHLDWAARMRIIMGVSYCLQYMHHELNPPVAINDMRSDTIFMTDDYAAKVADVSVWKEVATKAKAAKEESRSRSESPPDLASNVYCFGALLIEIISGRLPEADDQESMCNWAAEYLNGKNYSKLVDESLKDHNAKELEAVCEVIQQCIDPDSNQRPTIRDVIRKLRPVLNISPEAATPRLSPLWWAELEILSAEAT
ncbi:protein MALE DISCOVERER 2 isoform X2 [Oryza brachyantha]|uniref:protein MALE DISCOVERER 2 isoform X2 n=1 Tax=Oryza brachyantha TaxID=4533 RepID=UPI0003EA7F0C|nr:protein MALE DISCOVERER 2 isoform X2 [Oryza brachyantha]